MCTAGGKGGTSRNIQMDCRERIYQVSRRALISWTKWFRRALWVAFLGMSASCYTVPERNSTAPVAAQSQTASIQPQMALHDEFIAYCGYPGPDKTWEIFLMRGDGTDAARLEQTDLHGTDEGCFAWDTGWGDQLFSIQGLTWSSKGDRIAFTSTPGAFPGYAYVVTVTEQGKFGTLQRLWVANRLDFDEHQYLNWSPKDDRLTFISQPFSGPEGQNHCRNVYSASIDGSHYAQLTHVRQLPESVVEPVWSPDAEIVAVAAIAPHNGVGIAKSDGSGVMWLSSDINCMNLPRPMVENDLVEEMITGKSLFLSSFI